MEHPNGDISNADLFEAISGLSTHTDQQFAKVDQQFAAVNHQFKVVNERFDRVDARLEKIEDRIAAMQDELEYLRTQLERLERRTLEDSDAAAKEVVALRNDFSKFDTRLHALELKVGHA